MPPARRARHQSRGGPEGSARRMDRATARTAAARVRGKEDNVVLSFSFVPAVSTTRAEESTTTTTLLRASRQQQRYLNLPRAPSAIAHPDRMIIIAASISLLSTRAGDNNKVAVNSSCFTAQQLTTRRLAAPAAKLGRPKERRQQQQAQPGIRSSGTKTRAAAADGETDRSMPDDADDETQQGFHIASRWRERRLVDKSETTCVHNRRRRWAVPGCRSLSQSQFVSAMVGPFTHV